MSSETTCDWADDPGLRTGSRVHLIGIGGCGMRAAAGLLLHSGLRVSGSDQSDFAGLGDLVAAGATVHVGHSAAHLPDDLDLLVISAAIPEANPELHEARRRGCPIITYAQLVGRLMSRRQGVSIAGTHGKSTTTALTAHIYRTGGLDPSFIVGAHSDQLGGSSGVGKGPHFIVESCEYARSFLHHRPVLAAILNIEKEHLDCYTDLPDIVAAFAAFADSVSPDGLLIARHDDANVAQATRQAAAPVETFGIEPSACWTATDLRADQGRYSFAVHYRQRKLFETALDLPGEHNVTNALAAAALAFHGGVAPDAIAQAIRTYRGIDRRMSVRGTGGGVTVVDDYAHHPTEIRATLHAARCRFQPRRTWVVFQPHQHSRTRLLMDEFAGCFTEADIVLVSDIYSVRDSDEERRKTKADDLVSRIHAGGGQARYLPTLEQVASHLIEQVTSGDLVITMGAGDVWKVADELAQRVTGPNRA
ncbi:MAG TPA: UDP-N-acetylmuramate--L-alanine ligase [Phycisphaerae bacterium]|nr:UDP-N-acetylmuramate--L-alanine ligase [Phycisphaerae bacterium]